MEYIKNNWKSIVFLVMAGFIIVLIYQYVQADGERAALVQASILLEKERNEIRKTVEETKKDIKLKETAQKGYEDAIIDAYGKITNYQRIIDNLRKADYSAERNDTLEKCRENLLAAQVENEALSCQVENYKQADEDKDALIFNLKDQIASRDILILKRGEEIVSLTSQLNITATVAKMQRRTGLISMIKDRFVVAIGPSAGINLNGRFWVGAGITAGIKIN